MRLAAFINKPNQKMSPQRRRIKRDGPLRQRPQSDAPLKQGKAIVKLLFVMVDALPHEIKERLQVITPSQNCNQFFKETPTRPVIVANFDRCVEL